MKSTYRWEPKKTENSEYIGKKVIIYTIDNRKTKGILTLISKYAHGYNVIIEPFNRYCESNTICSNLIKKVEVELEQEIIPIITSKFNNEKCLDASTIALEFTNFYVEI